MDAYRERGGRAADLSLPEPPRRGAGRRAHHQDHEADPIKLWLLADRGYPLGVVTLPEDVVGDVDDLVARAQAANPAVSLDRVVQAIWTLGRRGVDDNLRQGIPVRTVLGSTPSTTLAGSPGIDGWDKSGSASVRARTRRIVAMHDAKRNAATCRQKAR